MTIEVQCTSCHTRYRIEEHVLPEGTPTFKCSRCGHVFSLEPRATVRADDAAAPSAAAQRPPRAKRESRQGIPESTIGEKSVPNSQSGWVARSDAADNSPASAKDIATAFKETETASPVAIEPASSPIEKKSSTDELLSKPFRDEQSPPGENLRFDFSDEPPEPEAPARAVEEIASDRDAGEWQVGDPDLEEPPQLAPAGQSLSAAGADESAPASKARRATVRPPKRSKPDKNQDFLDEDAAPIYNRSVAPHSARFFVGLFVLVAIGYGAMTVLIRSAPASAAEALSRLPMVGQRFILPIAPARLVAMRDVHSDYLRTKGGHTALVVTGIAENVGERPLHTIQIAVSLRDAAQRTLANQAVYCGNNLSAQMVTQMTPHELEFFQKLDPPKTFTLDPLATSSFVIVFIDPPPAVSRFDVSVASAGAATPPPSDVAGG